MNKILKIINKKKMSLKFIDIGANLTDQMYEGKYNGSQKHPADLDKVLERSWKIGMHKMILTVGQLSEVNHALKIASLDDRLFITIGCHPTRCNDFLPDPEYYYKNLCKSIEENLNKVVAIGECGLDYDRLKFCNQDVQKLYFEKQLDLAEKYNLPLFLHCRNSHEDFFKIVERNKNKIFPSGGVVHSFDGSILEAKKYIEFGFFIGINGCSLKTEENLKVVKDIPNERLMIETDCPWCSIRNSSAASKFIKTKFTVIKKKENWKEESLIDGRNEPCNIMQVLEVLAAIKNESVENLGQIIYNNTMNLFFKK